MSIRRWTVLFPAHSGHWINAHRAACWNGTAEGGCEGHQQSQAQEGGRIERLHSDQQVT